MDLIYLKKLIRIVEQSTINEIEIEEENLHVRISKGLNQNPVPVQSVPLQPIPAVVPQTVPKHAAAETPHPTVPPAASKEEVKYHEIKSPIVGTFYRAPAPDADSYVEVGSVVQQKQVICIIEAMKLMNEIECDVSGRIVKILVENGKPVEYNQALFLIEPL